MLIGLQLPSILEGLTDVPHDASCSGSGVVVSLTVIVTRIVWVFPATYLPRWLSARIRAREPAPPATGRRSSCRGRACAASSRWPRRSPCRRTSRSAT